jgi:hypothetical protein
VGFRSDLVRPSAAVDRFGSLAIEDVLVAERYRHVLKVPRD